MAWSNPFANTRITALPVITNYLVMGESVDLKSFSKMCSGLLVENKHGILGSTVKLLEKCNIN